MIEFLFKSVSWCEKLFHFFLRPKTFDVHVFSLGEKSESFHVTPTFSEGRTRFIQ